VLLGLWGRGQLTITSKYRFVCAICGVIGCGMDPDQAHVKWAFGQSFGSTETAFQHPFEKAVTP
jgi:hypothetical protein